MEFIKRMVREAVQEALPREKEKEEHVFLTERLISDFKFDEEMPYESSLPESEWLELCKAMFDVVKYTQLKQVKMHLINDVISDAIRHCKSMGDVNFNRATINGIELVFDEIERLALIYKADAEEKREERESLIVNEIIS